MRGRRGIWWLPFLANRLGPVDGCRYTFSKVKRRGLLVGGGAEYITWSGSGGGVLDLFLQLSTLSARSG